MLVALLIPSTSSEVCQCKLPPRCQAVGKSVPISSLGSMPQIRMIACLEGLSHFMLVFNLIGLVDNGGTSTNKSLQLRAQTCDDFET